MRISTCSITTSMSGHRTVSNRRCSGSASKGFSTVLSTRNPPKSGIYTNLTTKYMFYTLRTDVLYRASVALGERERSPTNPKQFLGSIRHRKVPRDIVGAGGQDNEVFGSVW